MQARYNASLKSLKVCKAVRQLYSQASLSKAQSGSVDRTKKERKMTNNSRYCRSLGDQNGSKTIPIPFGAAHTYMAYTVKPVYNGPVYSGHPVYYGHRTSRKSCHIYCKVGLYIAVTCIRRTRSPFRLPESTISLFFTCIYRSPKSTTSYLESSFALQNLRKP